MQSVFKGIYKTISNYQNEITSSPLQFAGALALSGTPTRFRLPVGFASVEGVYTAIETTAGITWNGVALSPGDVLTGKLSIDPPSGYAVIIEPYLDTTGKKVKVGLRTTDESAVSHKISFDTSVVNAGQVNEGTYIHVYDQSEDLQSRTMYYSASVLNSADFADKCVTGSFTMTNGIGTFSKQIIYDLTTEGDELLQFKIANDSSFSKVVGYTPVITVKDISKAPVVTVSSTAVKEGEKITVNVSFAAGAAGSNSIYYYVIDSTLGLINSNDFVDGTLNGSFTIDSATKIGTFSKILKRDLLTEGSESFNVYIKSDSISGPTLSTTAISVTDSSRGSGSINASLACSVVDATEGQTLVFTLSDPDQQFQGSFSYCISGSNGFDRFDFVDNSACGFVNYSGTSATFTKTIRNDYAQELNEKLKVKIGTSLKQYFSFAVYDRPGDGWDGGGSATILVNGSPVIPYYNENLLASSTLTMTESGTTGPKFFNFPVEVGDVITLNINPGSYSESSFRIYTGKNGAGQMIYNVNDLPGGTGLVTGLANVTALASYFTSAHDVSAPLFPAGVTLPTLDVNIVDNSPTFGGYTCSIVSPQASYNEGSTITFQVNDASGYSGNINYSIATVAGNITSGDFTTLAAGSQTMTNGVATISVVLKNDMSLDEGQETFALKVSRGVSNQASLKFKAVKNPAVPATTSADGVITVEVYDGSPTNSLFSSSTTSYIAGATTTSTSAAGLSSEIAYIKIASSTSKYLMLEIYDGLTDELLGVYPTSGFIGIAYPVRIPSNRYSYVSFSPNVVVNDTSTRLPASLSVSALTASEGSSIQFTVTDPGNGAYNGTAYYVISGSSTGTTEAGAVTNLNKFDFVDGKLSGVLNFDNGVATVTKQLTRDFLTETGEKFDIKVGPSIKQYFSAMITDTFGDGWNAGSGTITITGVNGSTTTNISMAASTSGPAFYNFEASPGDNVGVSFIYGTYTNESRVRIYTGIDGTGTLVYDSGLLASNVTATVTSLPVSYFDRAHTLAAGGQSVPTYLTQQIDTQDSNIGPWVITPSNASYDEGTTITFSVSGSEAYNGKMLYKIVSTSGSFIASDVSSWTSLSGSFPVTSGSGVFTMTLANDLSMGEGNEKFNLFITSGPSIRIVAPTGATPPTTGPTLSIYNTDRVNTSTVVSTLSTTCGAGGTVYNLDNVYLYDELLLQITAGVLKTQIEIYSMPDATGELLGVVAGDVIRNYYVKIPNAQYAGVSAGAGPRANAFLNIIVNDTSKIPVPVISVSPVSYNEGATITVSVSNVDNGTYYYTLDGTGINSNDFTTALNGSFAVTNATSTSGSGTFSINVVLKNDNTVGEGVETFAFNIRQGSITGPIVASSTSITINDTSSFTEKIPVNGTTGTNALIGVVGGYKSRATEYVYTAAELTAAGLSAGSVIKGIKFYLSTAMMTTYTWSNFVIGMQHTTQTASITASTISGYTEVYRRNGPFTPNTSDYNSLTTPIFIFSSATGITGANFTWNGTSNLLIKVAFGLNSYFQGATGTAITYTGGSTRYVFSDTVAHTLASSANTIATARPKIGLLV